MVQVGGSSGVWTRTMAGGGTTIGTGVPVGYVLLTDIYGQPLIDIFGAYMWGLA